MLLPADFAGAGVEGAGGTAPGGSQEPRCSPGRAGRWRVLGFQVSWGCQEPAGVLVCPFRSQPRAQGNGNSFSLFVLGTGVENPFQRRPRLTPCWGSPFTIWVMLPQCHTLCVPLAPLKT